MKVDKSSREPIVIDGIQSVMALVMEEKIINRNILELRGLSSTYFGQPRCYPQGSYLYLGKKFGSRVKLATNGARLVRAFFGLEDPKRLGSAKKANLNLMTMEEVALLRKSLPDLDLWQAQLEIYLGAYEAIQDEFFEFASQKYVTDSLTFDLFRLSSFEVCRDYRLMPEAIDGTFDAIELAVSKIFGPRTKVTYWTKEASKKGLQIEWQLGKGTGSGRYESTKIKLYRKTSTTIRLEVQYSSPNLGVIIGTDLEAINKALAALVEKAKGYLDAIDDAVEIPAMTASEAMIIEELGRVVKKPMAKDCYRYFVRELAKNGCFDVSQAPIDYRGSLTYMLRKAIASSDSFVERQNRTGNRGPIKRFYYVVAPRLRTAS